MPMNLSSPSPKFGETPPHKINAPKIFIVLMSVVVAGAFATAGVQAIGAAMQRADEDRAAKNLCRSMVAQILADAKQNPPEVGIYEATLSETDSWKQPLTSVLIVEELSNSATVSSTWRDRVVSDDDYSFHQSDVHVRKSVLKGITAGAHSAGKGLTSGVIEGLGEATDASLKKAKAGAKKVKTSLMGRFKKKEEPKDEDD